MYTIPSFILAFEHCTPLKFDLPSSFSTFSRWNYSYLKTDRQHVSKNGTTSTFPLTCQLSLTSSTEVLFRWNKHVWALTGSLVGSQQAMILFSLAALRRAEAPTLSGRINNAQKSSMALVMRTVHVSGLTRFCLDCWFLFDGCNLWSHR